jgi:hypothetical protein
MLILSPVKSAFGFAFGQIAYRIQHIQYVDFTHTFIFIYTVYERETHCDLRLVQYIIKKLIETNMIYSFIAHTFIFAIDL